MYCIVVTLVLFIVYTQLVYLKEGDRKMLVSNEIERLRVEEFDNIGKVEFSKLIGSNPATYSHVINDRRLPNKKFLYNLALATRTDYIKWLELLEQDRVELNQLEKSTSQYLSYINTGSLKKALKLCKEAIEEYNPQSFEEFAEEYLSEAPKEELTKQQNDTCRDTINMLIKIRKITAPEDVYNDETVKDMVLSAAKFEIEELLNKKALEK